MLLLEHDGGRSLPEAPKHLDACAQRRVGEQAAADDVGQLGVSDALLKVVLGRGNDVIEAHGDHAPADVVSGVDVVGVVVAGKDDGSSPGDLKRSEPLTRHFHALTSIHGLHDLLRERRGHLCKHVTPEHDFLVDEVGHPKEFLTLGGEVADSTGSEQAGDDVEDQRLSGPTDSDHEGPQAEQAEQVG